MQQRFRLRRRSDITAVYRRGRAWSNDVVVIRALPNERENNRYAFAVSRKVGSAVVRNRVRRRLREAVRALPFAAGADVVLIARPVAARLPFSNILAAVRDCARRAKLLVSAAIRP